nr:MAG TPA_asm: hypothetical protein [Caudoviricetes sp.]
MQWMKSKVILFSPYLKKRGLNTVYYIVFICS